MAHSSGLKGSPALLHLYCSSNFVRPAEDGEWWQQSYYVLQIYQIFHPLLIPSCSVWIPRSAACYHCPPLKRKTVKEIADTHRNLLHKEPTSFRLWGYLGTLSCPPPPPPSAVGCSSSVLFKWQRLMSLMPGFMCVLKAHSVGTEGSQLNSRQLCCDLLLKDRQGRATCPPLQQL